MIENDGIPKSANENDASMSTTLKQATSHHECPNCPILAG